MNINSEKNAINIISKLHNAKKYDLVVKKGKQYLKNIIIPTKLKILLVCHLQLLNNIKKP